jgi:hypothetical protein
MSNTQHDPGGTYLWRPFGTFAKGTGIASSAVAISGFTTAADGLYRIDQAVLIIDYHQGDLDCSCDMLLNSTDAAMIPFLSVSASPKSTADAPYSDNRWMAQLANPFYVYGNFGIFIQGESALTSASTIWATVAISSAWGP